MAARTASSIESHAKRQVGQDLVDDRLLDVDELVAG